MSRHSAEPWHPSKICALIKSAENNVLVAEFFVDEKTLDVSIAYKNRDRAIACVNALTGIPSPSQFMEAHRRLVEAAKAVRKAWPTQTHPALTAIDAALSTLQTLTDKES